MIDYELAKKLEMAGFPNIRLCGREEPHEIAKCSECDAEHYPTLSELIEACGRKFHCLVLRSGSDKMDGPAKWGAYSYPKDDGPLGYGATPDVAVANLWLWLALHAHHE